MNGRATRASNRGDDRPFTGEYEHRLDDRGRLAIPSPYRGLFEHGGFLLPGPDGQIELYTPEAYAAEKQVRTVDEKLSASARRLARSFFGRVRRVETDRQGRILIPPQMRQERNLNGETVIIGMGDYLEIWNSEAWHNEQAEIDEGYAELLQQLAEGSRSLRTARRSRLDFSRHQHIPVMVDEVPGHARRQVGRRRYLDATVGLGGHAEALLTASGADGRLLGCDADPNAIAVASKRLAPFGDRVSLQQCWMDDAANAATVASIAPLDGVLCDLGVSSLQLDTPERGFSFQAEGPLDMQLGPSEIASAFDTSDRATADEIVNEWSSDDLANLIYEYGEERRSRRIARTIVARRPIATLPNWLRPWSSRRASDLARGSSPTARLPGNPP